MTGNTTNGTCLDEIYVCIENHHDISDGIASNLKRFWNDNEYDTEAIEDDINALFVTSSNILNYIGSKACIDTIQECINNLKCMLLYIFHFVI